MMAMADAVEINGIYYNLIEKGKVAEVTSNPNKYSGEVVIPEKVIYNEVEYRVTTIGYYAFQYCYLTSITIPNSVASIGNGAFYGCSGLKKVNISSLSSWCNISFGNYDSNPCNYAHHLYLNGDELTDVSIPNDITNIKNFAFYGCSGLTSVTIGNSVTSIGGAAFQFCSGLTSITIGNGVTSIGDEAFYYCIGLTKVNISSLSSWCNISFGNYDSSPCNYAHHLYLNGEDLTNLSIPNNITEIKNYAFFGCSGLTSITIPNSVTSIGSSAFYNCSGLTSITIPNSVTSIGSSAFENCSGLKTVMIGSGISSIKDKAFSSCKELTDVYCYAKNVPSTNSNAFNDSYIEYATLHVPSASVNAYKTAAPWKNFKSIVAIDGDTPQTKKCATPTISYDNYKLTYSCETDGAECVATIKDADVKTHYGNETNLSATYNISVYAMKSGYDNSDVATATLVWTNATFSTGGVSSAKAMNLQPLLIQTHHGNVNIQGAEDGTRVAVYSVSGQLMGSAITANHSADISTSLKTGDVAIIKVGQRSVKVIMK